MKKHTQEEGGGDSWMNTYSDMVTLLLCFFVLLLSFSETNVEKWEKFVKAFMNPGSDTAQIVVLDPNQIELGDGPVPDTNSGQPQEGMTQLPETSTLPEDFEDLYLYLESYIEEHNLGSSIEVSTDGENVVYIRFQNNIFFRPDKYDLLPSATEILDFVGDCLHSVEDQIYIISINGHTADVGQADYNISDWMLSSERASNVAIYLEEKEHITPQKLRPMGYGKNYPIASNDTQEGREQNRRVDITIIRDAGEGAAAVNDDLASLFDPSQFPKSGGALDILSPETQGGNPVSPDAPEVPEEIPEVPDETPEETPDTPDPTGNS